jgi:hypothetical protein
MNKFLLILTTALLYSFSTKAQSLTLYDPTTNAPVINGDTIAIHDTIFCFNSHELTLGNISLSNKSVKVQMTNVSLITGAESLFSFGLFMYPPTVLLTPNATIVDAQSNSTYFSGTFTTNDSVTGISIVKYHFFDINNTTDTIDIVFKYIISTTTGLPVSHNNNNSALIQQGTNHFLSISFETSQTNEQVIEIYSVSGNLISKIAIPASQSTATLDLSNVKSGMYLLKTTDTKTKVFNVAKFFLR